MKKSLIALLALAAITGACATTATNEVTTGANGEPYPTVRAELALQAFVNQTNNNCQPADAQFGCVNDPTKPSPLPGPSLWDEVKGDAAK